MSRFDYWNRVLTKVRSAKNCMLSRQLRLRHSMAPALNCFLNAVNLHNMKAIPSTGAVRPVRDLPSLGR